MAELQGEFQVKGSLASGLSLESVDLIGTGPLRRLKADFLGVDYKLIRLIQGKVDGVRGEGLDIWVDISRKTKEAKKKKSSSKTPIREVREKVIPIAIQVHHSRVLVSNGDQRLWEVDGLSIKHRRDEDDYVIYFDQMWDRRGGVLKGQKVDLIWKPAFTEVKNFPLMSDLRVKDLICEWGETSPTRVDSQILWKEAEVHVELTDLKKAELRLTKGKMDLSELELDGRLGGWVNKLDFSVNDMKAPPLEMIAKLNIEGDGVRWGDKKIKRLEIESTLKEGDISLLSHVHLVSDKENEIKLHGRLQNNVWNTCWHDLQATADMAILDPSELAMWAGATRPIGGWPTGGMHIFAEGGMLGETLGDAVVKIDWESPKWTGMEWKKIISTVHWRQKEQEASLSLDGTQLAGGIVSANVKYSPKEQGYKGAIVIEDLDIAKFRPVLDLFKKSVPRAGIVNMQWSGQGYGKDIKNHQGRLKLTVDGLEVEDRGSPRTHIQLVTNYQKGTVIEVEKLQLKRGEMALESMATWRDNVLKISEFSLHDKSRVLVEGGMKLPLSPSLTSFEEFLKQQGGIEAHLHVKNLSMDELIKNFPEAKSPPVKGNITADFTLSGTLQKPSIQLVSRGTGLKVVGKDQIPMSDIQLRLVTQNEEVLLNGVVTPEGYRAIDLAGKMPFNIKRWMDQPGSWRDEPISAKLDTHEIDMAPLVSGVCAITHLEGSVMTQVQVTGSLAQPQVDGISRIKIVRLSLKNPSAPEIRNLDLHIDFTQESLRIQPSSFMASGGKFTLLGNVGFKDRKNPDFDLSLIADKALMKRDDAMIVRADAKISLKGSYRKALLAGDVDIVESMFYKDIQIIPMGGVSNGDVIASPGRAKLPSFKRPSNKKKSAIPSPFDQWEMDLKIRTKEDFLIRGNVAKGKVSGKLRIKGTFANPQPDGEFKIHRLEASLPFSQLQVKKGSVKFTPKTGFDPLLDIKAVSHIGSHDVLVTIYGRATSPQHLLTSNPPLPEKEIYFLLATGSTMEGLSGSDAAKGKAWQLLVDSWVRSSPGKNVKLKALVQRLNRKVNVNIGATDPFTGKTFNSATVKLHRRWYLMASINSENNTRGLVLYTIKFK